MVPVAVGFRRDRTGAKQIASAHHIIPIPPMKAKAILALTPLLLGAGRGGGVSDSSIPRSLAISRRTLSLLLSIAAITRAPCFT
ncbi:hypothetical protein D3C72_2350390 [compost metagenome]